jgi:hypothetical protein
MTDRGAELEVSIFVLTKNLWRPNTARAILKPALVKSHLELAHAAQKPAPTISLPQEIPLELRGGHGLRFL